MSKSSTPFLKIFASLVLALCISQSLYAQDLEATIKVDPVSRSLNVNGRFGRDVKGRRTSNLSFMLEYAGVTGLGKRFSSILLTDNEGSPVPNRRVIDGEYIPEGVFSGWSYSIDLTPLADHSAAAHISWLTPTEGVLMLDDLLPQNGEGTTARVTFDMPSGWTVISAEKRTGSSFEVANTEKAVFYIAEGDTTRHVKLSKTQLSLNITGSWLFTDKEAADMAGSVFAYYEKLFGSVPSADVVLGLRKFPTSALIGNWEADTRGSTITIVSSDMPFKSQSLQRLHEQLRHELFHLWIPNGVNLSGNYDWFYEGFALYQSLKMGVAANQIRFEDMLDTLSRAYAIDRRGRDRISLIEASNKRWTRSNTDIYARGMLVAFLCDISLLDRTRGKMSVSGLVAGIYQRHRSPNVRSDGNTAVLSSMRSNAGLDPIVSRYIEGRDKIDMTPLLKAAGLEFDLSGTSTTIKVVAKPSGRQKELLDDLGYNSWRKLSRKQ